MGTYLVPLESRHALNDDQQDLKTKIEMRLFSQQFAQTASGNKGKRSIFLFRALFYKNRLGLKQRQVE